MPPFAGQQSASTNNNQNPNTGFGFGFGSNNNNNNNHTANNNNNATNSFNLGFGTSGSSFGTTAGGTNAFTTTTTSTGFNFGYPTNTTNNNQTNNTFNTGFGIVHTTNNNIANNNSNTFNFNDNNDESTFPQFHAISYTEANNNQAIHYQCITANSKYKDSSLEEYRYQYYLKNNLIKDFTKSTNNCSSKNEFIYSFHFFKDLNLFNSILSKQFDNERYSDFIIRFYYSNNTDENVEIPPPIYTHKSIITYFSQVFKTMLQNVTMIESTNNEILIDLNEDDYDVFYSMIKSFYFKDVINCCKNPSKGVTSNYLFNLLLMYDKYGCDELKLPLVDYFMTLEECFLKPILENSYLFLNENKHLKRLLFNLFDRLMLNLDEKLWNYITSNGLLDSITVDILVPYLEEKLVPNAFPIKYESLLTSLRRFSFKSLQEGTELCTSFNCMMAQLLDKVLNTNYQTNVETTLFTHLNEFILLLPLASDVKIYYLTQTNNLCIRILNQVKGYAAPSWGNNPNPQTGFVFGPTPPAPFNTTTAIPPTFGATGGFGATHSSNF